MDSGQMADLPPIDDPHNASGGGIDPVVFSDTVTCVTDEHKITGHPIRCLQQDGVWAERVMISCEGTYVVCKVWSPLKQKWDIVVHDMSDSRCKLTVQPGWGSRVSTHKKFNALQLLFLASKSKDFDYYGNLECVPVDMNVSLSIHNVQRGRVERCRKSEKNVLSRHETPQEPQVGEVFKQCAYHGVPSEKRDFYVSSLGRIRTFLQSKMVFMLGRKCDQGYRIYRDFAVHVLVKTTFDPLKEEMVKCFGGGGLTVDHKNRKRDDNRLENLDYSEPVSQKENQGADATPDDAKRKLLLSEFVVKSSMKTTITTKQMNAPGLRFIKPLDGNKLSKQRGWYLELLQAFQEGGSAALCNTHLGWGTRAQYISKFFRYLRLEDVPQSFWGDTATFLPLVKVAVHLHNTYGRASVWNASRENARRDLGLDIEDTKNHPMCKKESTCGFCSLCRGYNDKQKNTNMGIRMQLVYCHVCLHAGGPRNEEAWP